MTGGGGGGGGGGVEVAVRVVTVPAATIVVCAEPRVASRLKAQMRQSSSLLQENGGHNCYLTRKRSS